MLIELRAVFEDIKKRDSACTMLAEEFVYQEMVASIAMVWRESLDEVY
jgi:hypothetical protein